MKRLLIAALFVFMVAAPALAQWSPVYTNQMTVKWLASTTLVDGSPVPAEDSVVYEILVRKLPDGAEQILGRTSDLTYTVTIPSEGEWAVGLKAIRITSGGDEYPSEINWSTEDGEATPNPFSVIYMLPPAMPTGLEPQ